MSSKVLVIEDNSGMREALTLFLSSNGFKVSAYDSTEDGIDAVDEQDFDIGLIDINLPGKSGFSMIEYIRESGNAMPLIAMTARDGLQDKLNGFELGLTDYVVKPFELKELLARMQVHLRNLEKGSDKSQIITKNFELDPSAWKFMRHQKTVELTNTEFRIMHFLMKHNKTVVRLDDLVEFVWGDDPNVINPPVRIHIANLRKKIGDNELVIIKTIPGIGYRFSDPLND
jgi:two-component system copper resistance phosphate regulon response regulator CusR